MFGSRRLQDLMANGMLFYHVINKRIWWWWWWWWWWMSCERNMT